jgi:hypothetical protein
MELHQDGRSSRVFFPVWCYVFGVMALLRTPSMTLMLLLALALPLQSFASAWSCSANDSVASAAHAHCADDSGKPQTGGEQRHHCGTCCAAAIAWTPFRWDPPRSASTEASLPFYAPPPRIALDRLDRPPRMSAD